MWVASGALRTSLCPSCLRHFNKLECSPGFRTASLQNSDRVQRRQKSEVSRARKEQQANPIKGYYKLLLNQPLYQAQSATRTAPTPPPTDKSPKSAKEENLAKARVVFGSRLAGPGERRAERAQEATNIAGVMVPPRPTEPDNCCMSGCVNCVWDQFRDEIEEWAALNAQARQALQKQRDEGRGSGLMLEEANKGGPTHVAVSMDDDGGGSESNWGTGLAQSIGKAKDEDLFAGIPVGIREFMRTEKRLKEKHEREGSIGG